ncbi:MAG: hypothetical protein ACD_63C00067G0001 [uncultured bacterium]|nr:MAG: hypothetical protein ACD_63C00067G0001 [uncultured bacterium]
MDINLSHGSGGKDSLELVGEILRRLKFDKKWIDKDDDAAALKFRGEYIVFTTDSYIVDPIFFAGGDIGKLAVCGTINDLSVKGAEPLGLSLSFVIEDGFSKKDFDKILDSISKISKKEKVPIVTGDTKVMEKGSVDKIIINTSGIGLAKKLIRNSGLSIGDVVVLSGSIGDHAVALLSKRFDYDSNLKSDCAPIFKEVNSVKKYLHACKDPTRGGIASVLNEIAEKSRVKIVIDEEAIPVKKETRAVSELLGLDVYSLACEGRFVCGTSLKNFDKVLKTLKKYSKDASIIGKVEKGLGVVLKTEFGERFLDWPEGKLVPRIC